MAVHDVGSGYRQYQVRWYLNNITAIKANILVPHIANIGGQNGGCGEGAKQSGIPL